MRLRARSRGLLVALACLAAVAGFLAAAYHEATKDYHDPNPRLASVEVQRYFDEQAPGQILVGPCEYVDDPSASVFDRYSCVIYRRERRTGFSVPRAATFGRSNVDPAPVERRLPGAPAPTQP